HESFARLRLDATILAGDAANPDRWWDGRAFDRIVIDAPCSASGVIRRYPDIKHLRRAGDLPVLAARQQQLLRALWPLVAEGGCLLFATCSIFRAENGAVVQEFTRDTANVRLDNQLRDGNISGVMRAEPYGLSMLPGTQEADGFFISRLWREP
ncbi:MAG: 16S rRNA (cytosine(967)-C(5))-methyltransferase RsmB, partial [Pseudomonadota bacterium]